MGVTFLGVLGAIVDGRKARFLGVSTNFVMMVPRGALVAAGYMLLGSTKKEGRNHLVVENGPSGRVGHSKVRVDCWEQHCAYQSCSGNPRRLRVLPAVLQTTAFRAHLFLRFSRWQGSGMHQLVRQSLEERQVSSHRCSQCFWLDQAEAATDT